jgi:hypothetical protein
MTEVPEFFAKSSFIGMTAPWEQRGRSVYADAPG